MILAALLLFAAAEPPSFQLSALSGSTVRYADVKGEKLTVVAFLSIKCPISQAYQARMSRFYGEYASKGVSFLFVDANANESAAEIELYAKQARLAFPVYKDYNNRAADFFDAQTTPELYVLDERNEIRYRGAIDDSTNEARVKTHGFRDALDALLQGQAPKVAELKAFGCVLKRVKGTS